MHLRIQHRDEQLGNGGLRARAAERHLVGPDHHGARTASAGRRADRVRAEDGLARELGRILGRQPVSHARAKPGGEAIDGAVLGKGRSTTARAWAMRSSASGASATGRRPRVTSATSSA